jgi:hypothetical protein
MRGYRIRVVGCVLALVACNPDVLPPATSFDADLTGANEVPAVATSAAGNATVEISGGSLNYTLNITTAPATAVTFAHIHQGTSGVSGAIRVNLCGTGAPVPACPAGSGTVTGSAAAAAVQGISIDSLLILIRSAQTYINVHTTANPGGEIRGQLIGTP